MPFGFYKAIITFTLTCLFFEIKELCHAMLVTNKNTKQNRLKKQNSELRGIWSQSESLDIVLLC